MTIQEAKNQIVEYSKRLYNTQMVSVFEGNISIRLEDRFVITPTHTDKNILTPEMLVEINENGEVLNPECGKNVSTEWKMHIEAYRVRKDINAIIHCHSPYATAYAMCGKAIEPKGLTEAIEVFREIPLVPYGRPGTPDIAAGFKEILPEHDAALLEAHGVIILDAELPEAYAKAEAVEKIARMEFIASLLGGEKSLPEAEISVLKQMLK